MCTDVFKSFRKSDSKALSESMRESCVGKGKKKGLL